MAIPCVFSYTDLQYVFMTVVAHIAVSVYSIGVVSVRPCVRLSCLRSPDTQTDPPGGSTLRDQRTFIPNDTRANTLKLFFTIFLMPQYEMICFPNSLLKMAMVSMNMDLCSGPS